MAYRYTDEQLLESLVGLAEELGHTPSKYDMTRYGPHSVDTYKRRFNSWYDALEEAGLETEFECSDCGKEFDRISNLQLHQTHSKACEHSDQIKEMYSEGHSSITIASELGIASNAVYLFLRDNELNRGRKQALEATWSHHHPLKCDFDSTIDEDMAWLVGVLLSDGCVFKSGSTHRLVLEVIDEEFADYFKNVVDSIGLHTNKRAYERKADRYANTFYSVHAHSKAFYEWWDALDREDFREIARSYPAAFVRAIYDSEGCLSQRSTGQYKISMHMTDRWILELVQELSSSSVKFLGPYVDRRSEYMENRKDLYRISLTRRKEVKRFCKWVNPILDRKNIHKVS